MKFLLLVVLSYVGLSLAQEEGWYDEDYYAGEEDAEGEVYEDYGGDRYYTKYRPYIYTKYHRGPTTEPKPIRQLFDLRRWEIEDIVDLSDETNYRLNEDIVDAVENKIIPELCNMTVDKINIYNSFLLDKQTLENLESVSPECRAFRCDILHYFLEHGARIYMDVIHAESYKAALQVISREILDGFRDLNVCTCGREFMKAVFKSAPYWHANALNAVTGNDEEDMISYYKAVRNVDVKTISKVFDRVLAGLCEESSHGMCINSVINGMEEMLDLVTNTMEDYEDYDDNDDDRSYQKSQERRCDALFGPIRTWTQDDRDMDYYEGEELFQLLFEKTSDVSKAFYCQKGCKKDVSRTAMYPCCWRRMMEDKNLFDNIVKFTESIYRAHPSFDDDWEWNFYELDDYYFRYSDFTREDLEEIGSWTLPEGIREKVIRTLHAAKYCDGRTVRCSL